MTLLFTDVEGSTILLNELGAEAYAVALADHRRVIREACVANGGVEVDTQGDAFFIAFPTAPGALAAAADLTAALAASGRIRVRVGVHTGTPLVGEEGYVGHDVHRAARIAAAGHGGQVLVSSSTARLVDDELTDLGEHRFKDLGAPERVYQLGVEAFPPLKSLYRASLPIPATPLLGRDRELETIADLIVGAHARLVTLTGPGGIGKTRLALQAAADLADGFTDGVFFVGLAPLRDIAAVRSAVAEAVGLGADADPAARLAGRRVLLVLDNLEHLRGVEGVVQELLVESTVVLATSRGPLRLMAEHELPLKPLRRDAAVDLFVSRAAAAGRQITGDETVAEICRRLDDLPLALELAAARVRLLSPQALLQRLDVSLSILTGGASDLPERHQTLRATIEWSHDLLALGAQAAFRRLSVFRGSFTLEAAEAIAGTDLDEVTTLVEQSLVTSLGDDRFFLLETLREYARERLDATGETDEYTVRHASWYLERLEVNHPDVQGPRHADFVAWFVAEEDNLRAMLTALSATSPTQAARAARLLHPYWKARGTYVEARQRLTDLGGHEDLPDRSRAELLGLLSDIDFLVGDLDASEASASASLRLTEPGTEMRGYALLGLAMVASARGESAEAVRLARDVLLDIDALDDQQRAVFRLDVGSVFRDAGEGEEARAMFVQAAAEARRVGNPFLLTLANGNACWLDMREQRYEAAVAGFRALLELDRSLGHARFEADTLRGLGLALLGLDRRVEARGALLSSLEILSASPTPDIELLATLRWIACAAEPRERLTAARLAGAIAAIRQRAGIGAWPGEPELGRRFEQPLIDALDEGDWARAQAAGKALTLEDAIEIARTLAASPLDPTPHPV